MLIFGVCLFLGVSLFLGKYSIVTCQAHPVLVKTGQMYGLFLFFFIFF